MSFEKKLQDLRKKAGLSQEELANQLGVSRQAVSKWESGISYPEMDKLILMTRLFKCSLDDLVNDEVKNVDVNNKVSKGQTYIDSLLEFITKTISMFNSMKLSSIVKCLLEMILFTIAMTGFLSIVYSILRFCLFEMSGYGTTAYYICEFISNILLICIIAFGAIVVFQFYKIRYLDYYDKLVFKYDLNESGKKEIIEDKNEDDEKVNKKVLENTKTKERIIIRDPHHKPLAFLSVISRLIILIYRGMLRLITIPFIFAFVYLGIALVIAAYLISYHTIFISVLIAIIACIVLNILFIYTLSSDLFKRAFPIRFISITFLASLLVISCCVGGIFINLSKIDFIDRDSTVLEEKTIPFNDKLYLNLFSGLENDRLDFIVDESRNDVLISVTYDNEHTSYTLENPAGNANYLLLNVIYDNEVNPKNEIEKFLNNLKKNTVIINDYRTNYFNVTVTANEKHIKSLINTISEYADVYTSIETRSGYKYYHLMETMSYRDMNEDKVCVMDDYYRKCITVRNNTHNDKFSYEYKNNKLIYDEHKYYCYVLNNGYVCERNRNISYDEYYEEN